MCAARWAREALAAKNSLTSTNAKLVEDAFERRLSELSPPETAGLPSRDLSVAEVTGDKDDGQCARRYRQKCPGGCCAPSVSQQRHLRYVAQRPCLLCARRPSDPHHLRFMQPRALGRKASDEFTVPLCRMHHRAVHSAGDERAWWKQTAIDPLKVARELWNHTRVSEGRVPADRDPQTVNSDRTLKSEGTSGKA